MVQLTGNLKGMGLPRLLRFLTDLHLNGRLRIAIEPGVSAGTVFLQKGKIVGAVIDSDEAGLKALEALAVVANDASFSFSDGTDDLIHNVDAECEALQEHLFHLANDATQLMRAIPSLMAVPRVTLSADGGHESLAISRGALRLLLEIRGDRTVLELGRRFGLRATVECIHELIHLRLVSVEGLRSSRRNGTPIDNLEASEMLTRN